MTDWLWHYLKRLPANLALVRASEARLFSALAAPDQGAILDWRDAPPAWRPQDSDGQYATILVSLAQRAWRFDPAWLHEACRLLALNGRLALSAPAEATPDGISPRAWAERLAQAGLAIEEWRYFISPAAQAACAAEDTRRAQLSYDLTGHYVLRPWPRLLATAAQRWRPWYDETTPPTGAYVWLVARKVSAEPIPPLLPPATSLTLVTEAGSAESASPDQPAPPQTEPTALPRAPVIPATWLSWLPWLWLGLALIAAFLAQSAWRANPEAPGGGLRWLLLALAGLWALRRWSERRDQPPAAPRRWPSWRDVPPPRWLYLLCPPVALLAYLATDRPIAAILLWLIAGLTAFTALDAAPQAGPAETPWDTPRWLALAITGAALILRTIHLTSLPFMLNGSEASLGLEAWRVATGQLHTAFGSAWLTHPTLPLFLLAGPLRIFGRTVLALRILPPLLGALTVYVTYAVGRRLWNPTAGLIAAVLLAGSAAHIHYSRLGQFNALDTLLLLLAVGAIANAWLQAERTAWLLAGAAVGLSAYGFTSARFLPLILLGWAATALLWHRPTLRAQGRHLLAAGLLALVVALPQALYYQSHPDVFMERANALGILRNGWLAAESARVGVPATRLLAQQATQAALGYNATPDRDATYNAGAPLLQPIAALFWLLGAGMALFHVRQMRYAGLVGWVGVTLIFGGALLVDPPQSRHLVTALPAVYLLAARALVWLGEKAWAIRPKSAHDARDRWLPAGLLILALVMAGLDTGFYFGRYQAEYRFGDRNTEIAFVLSNYLNDLEGDWTVYFHGPPSMYVGFSTLSFLATDFTPEANLFDVFDSAELPRAHTPNVVHIFLPERAAELNAVSASLPGGNTRSFTGHFAAPLFLAYEKSE